VSDGPTNDDVRAAWDANAAYWDEHMRAGKTWQRTVIAPSVEALLAIRPGDRVLELACGNGEFSRRMAEAGAAVLATDFSEGMLERARSYGGNVRYRSVDATDRATLDALAPDGPFDAVVVNMALMDMAELSPLAGALPGLLEPAGRFVMSVQHPAFNAGDVVRVLEQTDVDRNVVSSHAVRISTYRSLTSAKGIALVGQPEAQWYFNRPLSELLRPFLATGLVLDAIEEPTIPLEHADPSRPEFVFTEVPPILVARLRRR
jgi:SAM-dependent methyltransferase